MYAAKKYDEEMARLVRGAKMRIARAEERERIEERKDEKRIARAENKRAREDWRAQAPATGGAERGTPDARATQPAPRLRRVPGVGA